MQLSMAEQSNPGAQAGTGAAMMGISSEDMDINRALLASV